MATQSTLYDLESTESRFFLSTKNIASKSHVAIWIKGEDDIYRIQNESEYELINDTIVYPTVPSGKALEVRVGDSPSDLVNAPTDISIVSAIANEIIIVADNVQDIVNVSNNIDSITIVSDNMTELLVISDEIDLVLLSKEYAVNPEDVAITDNPSDFSSLHHASKSKASAEEAQTIVDSINFPAGLIMEWNTDRKPSGWLWCDGEDYSVFSPAPSLAYDELYAVLEDPTYVMTTKPEDWDINYPDDPNGWYDPAFAGSVVTQDELDLLVTVPDRRGVFVRGKDRHGSVGATRGLDSHGVVALNAVIPSQIQDHTHNYLRYYYTNDDTISGSGNSANNSDQYNTQTTTGANGATVGSETHGTYVTTNYIIRAKGSYNGDGTGSGGTGVVPIASEIDYSDTHNSGFLNLQDTTDDYFAKKAMVKTKGAIVVDESVFATSLAGNNNGRYFPDVNVGVGDTDIVYMCLPYNSSYNSINKIVNDVAVRIEGGNLISNFYTPAGDYAYRRNGGTNHSLTKATIDLVTGNVTYKTYSSGLIGDGMAHVVEDRMGYSIMVGQRHLYVIDDSDDSLVYHLEYAFGVITAVSLTHVKAGETQIHLAGGNYLFSHDFGFVLITSDISLSIYSTLSYRNGKYYFSGSDHHVYVVDVNFETGYISMVSDNGLLDNYNVPNFAVNDSGYAYHTDLTKAYGAIGTDHEELTRTNVLGERGEAYVIEAFEDSVDANNLGLHAVALGSGVAKGRESVSIGDGTTAKAIGSLAVGTHNIEVEDALLITGNGTLPSAQSNAFTVLSTGDVQAPSRLDTPTDKSLLTKDIADGLFLTESEADALYNNYSPTGYTGDIVVDSDAGTTVTTITVVDGLITGTAVV